MAKNVNEATDNGVDPNQVKACVDAVIAKHEELASVSGTIRNEIKELYRDGKKKSGANKRVLQQAVAEARRSMKERKRLAEWDNKDKNHLLQCREALGDLVGTPLGDFVVDQTDLEDHINGATSEFDTPEAQALSEQVEVKEDVLGT